MSGVDMKKFGSCGRPFYGCEMKLHNPDDEGNGEAKKSIIIIELAVIDGVFFSFALEVDTFLWDILAWRTRQRRPWTMKDGCIRETLEQKMRLEKNIIFFNNKY